MPKIILDNNLNSKDNWNENFRIRNFELDYTDPKRTEKLLSKLKNEDKFLDISCGLSPCFLLASKITNDITASDFSDELINLRKQQYPNINFVQCDLRNITLKENSFNYIVLGETLEHLENPRLIIDNIVKLLKPDGVLAISVPNNDNGSYSKDYHIWSFTEDEIKDLLNGYNNTIETLIDGFYNHIICFINK